jgi:hypothetical protein
MSFGYIFPEMKNEAPMERMSVGSDRGLVRTMLLIIFHPYYN